MVSMPPMEIDRRSLVTGGQLLAAVRPASAACSHGKGVPSVFAAIRRGKDHSYAAVLFDDEGREMRTVALPARGHDVCYSPAARQYVAFARRPGTFAVAFTADHARESRVFNPPRDRHFYGHGAFSRDGRLLYAVENDFDARRGVIGLYDVEAGYRRVGEFPSYGVGPHDIAILPRCNLLVVANGGYAEHPDLGQGRRILNPGQIETSLCFIDAQTGDLVDRQQFGLKGNFSLRHLDLAENGDVVLGGQYHREGLAGGPLLWKTRLEGTLSPISLPHEMEQMLKGYVSSVAVDASGRVAAFSSARGNVVLRVDLRSGKLIDHVRRLDISGVAPDRRRAGSFLVSSGTGELAIIDEASVCRLRQVEAAWDNHVASFPALPA